jgi:hypothetical protein
MDGVATKLVTGDAGYVLEDVPHLSDYLPDLLVSASVPRGLCGVLCRSIPGAAELGAVDRSLLRVWTMPPMRGVAGLGGIVESGDDSLRSKAVSGWVVNKAFCPLVIRLCRVLFLDIAIVRALFSVAFLVAMMCTIFFFSFLCF